MGSKKIQIERVNVQAPIKSKRENNYYNAQPLYGKFTSQEQTEIMQALNFQTNHGICSRQEKEELIKGKSLAYCSSNQKYEGLFMFLKFRDVVLEVLNRKYSEKGNLDADSIKTYIDRIYDFNEKNVMSVQNFVMGGTAYYNAPDGIKKSPRHQLQNYANMRACLDNFILPGNEMLLQLSNSGEIEQIKSNSGIYQRKDNIIPLYGYNFNAIIENLREILFVKFIRNKYNTENLLNGEIDIDAIKELVDKVITYNLKKSKIMNVLMETSSIPIKLDNLIDNCFSEFIVPDDIFEQIKGNER